MSLAGQQLDHYRIVRLLGSGGMGDVYLAEDARIEQQVAIKVVRTEVGAYPNSQAAQDLVRLFQREAKAIAKLDHSHILPLFAYGEHRVENMILVYLVMPYRQEGSLADWLRQRGQGGLLSPRQVAHFVTQAASALQHAHDRQIIHQDVKLSNFLLRSRAESPTRPDLLLADFGIARFSTSTSSASHSIRGTPIAMAPEQWEGHPVPASDQYALAVMAYELLTGRPPFQEAPSRLMYLHLMVPPPPPSTFNPRLSKDIDTVLLHALEKRPERRFASITAFANAFQQAAVQQAVVQSTEEMEALTLEAAINSPVNPVSPGAKVTPLISMLQAAINSPATLGDIQAALAISTAEAQTGTSRTLTMPGGRSVRVSVPPGVQNGSVLRLDRQGEVSPVDGRTGALILTILVKHEEPPSWYSTRAPIGAGGRTPLPQVADPPTYEHAPTVSSRPSRPIMSRTDVFTPLPPVEQVPEPASPSWYRRIFALLMGTAPLAIVSIWLVKSLVPASGHTPNNTVLALIIGVFLALPFVGGITTLALSGRKAGGGLGCMSGLLFGLVFFIGAFWDASLGSVGVGYALGQSAPVLIMGTLFFGFLAYLGACTYMGIRIGIRKARKKENSKA